MPFQQRYASLILELERINRDLNEYLIGVQQCCHEVCCIHYIVSGMLSWAVCLSFNTWRNLYCF